jgi:cell division protein FtsL
MVRKRATLKRKDSLAMRVKKIFFSSQGFPIILVCSILGILFVLFRMKSIETGYRVISVKKDIEESQVVNKELKAKRAKLLSVKNLHRLAKKHGLREAEQKQIIVIP